VLLQIYYNVKLTQKTEARFGGLYDIRPGNGTGIFWKEKIDKSGSERVRK